ncbi:MAG TPA: c-type cytochrome [Candidatus Acidoferrales bacterium]
MPEIPPASTPPSTPPDDPITSYSFTFPLLIASLLLIVTVAWSFWDEVYGLRPWRSYQSRFSSAYSKYLDKAVQNQKKQEDGVYSSPEYKKLSAQVDDLQKSTKAQDEDIAKQIALLDEQRTALGDAFKDARGKIGHLVYQYEIVPAEDKNAKAKALKEVTDGRKEIWKVDWPLGDGKIQQDKPFNADELNDTFTSIMAQRAALVGKRAELDKPAKEASDTLALFVAEKLPGLSSTSLDSLRRSMKDFDERIIQINVNPPGASLNNLGGAGLVDRCQSCHVGTDPRYVPLQITLTKADLGMAKSTDAPFTSHPDIDLLKWHPLEKFGCSPCHGGNGRAIDSVRRGHGRYEHWLWPLYYRENFEAGCQQCHAGDMVTEHAPVLNEGKQLYRAKGCIGCHRFNGFDNQDEQLVSARQRIMAIEKTKGDDEQEIPRLQKLGDNAPDNAAAEKFYGQATNLTVEISRMDAERETLEGRSHNLIQEIKKVGPDLKEARQKLHKDWIPYWIAHTTEFRRGTKMPQFRFAAGDVEAISAFIWQNALIGPALDHQQPGNSAHGKQLLESRGCLACHSVGEGSNDVGGTFAANLSRVGEKDNYDYLVRWVHNPRQRTRPYCSFEKRDLGPEDYAKHNLPFVFDEQHSRCPNDNHELVVQQPTVMPSLRLSPDDARDVASYLITLKHADATYADASFMDDPAQAAKGKELVRHYGCAGCHEISGFEDEGRIGTELTNEGSKPIERLDFALYTEDAKRGILPDGKKSERGPWFDSKGFFEEKLRNPGLYDQGKYHANPMDALRMPKPNLQSNGELEALVTMLLGSTDPTLPPEYMFKPFDRRRYIEDGWWIVTKYNCIGCHQIDVGQKTVLQTLPFYQGENKANLPPVLTTEGARVNPEWLRQFLANPSLSSTDTNRNGVRQYLQVRMPTFYLSDDEIRKIVLFFQALSSQPTPFIPPSVKPLDPTETAMARSLFTSPAAPCLKCHMTGNPEHDKNASAPNFLLAHERLQPAWTERWITDPAKIIPGTAMPSGLFRKEGDRWVFAGPVPGSMEHYTGDEANLLVRYMFSLTPQEQAALLGRTPSGGGAKSAGGN